MQPAQAPPLPEPIAPPLVEPQVAKAKCREAFKDWVMTLRPRERFEVPDGLTRQDCEGAEQAFEDQLESQRQEALRAEEEARRVAQERAELQRKLEDQRAAEEQRREAVERQRAKRAAAEWAKRPRPTIGMTFEQVSASRWGRPISTTRTTTAASVTETWSYPFGVLFFRDGRLEAIHER